MSKRVLLAAPRSFCAGVDRAIEIVERLLGRARRRRSTSGTRSCTTTTSSAGSERLGAVFVDDEDEIPRR